MGIPLYLPMFFMPAILVVDDDIHICELLVDVFGDYGFAVTAVQSGAQALAFLREHPRCDLIFLDLILPDVNGLDLLSRIKSMTRAPVIMLSGMSGEADIVVGLEMGADDYITKPFYPRETLARAKAALRRSRGADAGEQTPAVRAGLRFRNWLLDTENRRLYSPGQQEVALTQGEYALLHALLCNAGRVLSRQQLLELTHNENLDIFDRTVDVLIMRLRKKLEPNAKTPLFIQTVRGAGYVFGAAVEKVCPTA